MTRKAVLVGINYPGSSNELKGCINDIDAMHTIITQKFSFKPENIVVLKDKQATTKNILNELEKLVTDSVAGDVLFFHYSGHGSQVHDKSGKESDKLNEILVPIDIDWNKKMIKDDDLKQIFDRVPNGAYFLSLLDCCNSGGALDHDIDVISSNTKDLDSPDTFYEWIGESVKQLPILSKYMKPPVDIQVSIDESQSDENVQFIMKNINTTGLLISGCKSNQTSADAFLSGKHMGACTFFVTQILKDYNYLISHEQLVKELNIRLKKIGLKQQPQLEGNIGLQQANFLFPDVTDVQVSDVVIQEPTATVQKPNFITIVLNFIMSIFKK